MEKSNPEVINSLMSIIETFSYITIVFMFIFLFYFVKSEILEQKLERRQTMRALLFLFIRCTEHRSWKGVPNDDG